MISYTGWIIALPLTSLLHYITTIARYTLTLSITIAAKFSVHLKFADTWSGKV